MPSIDGAVRNLSRTRAASWRLLDDSSVATCPPSAARRENNQESGAALRCHVDPKLCSMTCSYRRYSRARAWWGQVNIRLNQDTGGVEIIGFHEGK